MRTAVCVVALCALALAASAARTRSSLGSGSSGSSDPLSLSYFISPAGPGATAPGPNFVLASLADVQTTSFINWYNTNGLSTPTTQLMTGCCVFALSYQGGIGYWTYGPADASGSSSYIAPFTSSGAHQCAETLSDPVFLGTAYAAGPSPNIFLGNLSTSTVGMFNVTSSMGTELGCETNQMVFGLWMPQGGPTGSPTPAPSQPPYIVGGAGQDFPTPPAGYQLTTLADITSSAFATYYNANGGLPVVSGLSMDGCCLFALAPTSTVSGGFLTYGAEGNESFIGPYLDQQEQCQESPQAPVQFGTDAAVGPFPSMAIPTLTPSIELLFGVAPNMSTQLGCQGTVNTFAVYTLQPPYVVDGAGQDFPNPPTGYELAALADIQSADFLTVYNAGGIPWSDPSGASMAGCCVFSQADGFLLYNLSNVAPYTTSGEHMCATQLSGAVSFGTAFDAGPVPGIYIGQLTPAQAAATLSVNETLNPQLGCSGSVDYFAVYKQAPTSGVVGAQRRAHKSGARTVRRAAFGSNVIPRSHNHV